MVVLAVTKLFSTNLCQNINVHSVCIVSPGRLEEMPVNAKSAGKNGYRPDGLSSALRYQRVIGGFS